MARFAVLELQRRGHRGLAERIAPYRAGYTPQQRRELERAAGRRRAARRRRDRRAGARDRHRRAGRGDLRHVPGHRRLAAADVGPRGAARARARDLRRGRGRARPVLLPPPGRVPRAAGRGRDPRPRERAALRRAPAVRGARGAAGAGRRATCSGRAGARSRRCWSATGDLRERPDGTFVPRRADEYPAGAVSLRSAGRDAVAIVDVESGELIGNVDAGPRALDRPPGRDLPARRARSSRSRRCELDDRRAFVRPFDGDWYTQPKRETDTHDRARCSATRDGARREAAASAPSW